MSNASFATILDILDWKQEVSQPSWVDIQKNFERMSLFGYDYAKLKKDNAQIKLELVELLFHPLRIQKWLESGHELEDYLN